LDTIESLEGRIDSDQLNKCIELVKSKITIANSEIRDDLESLEESNEQR
jgi:hypothetical protein